MRQAKIQISLHIRSVGSEFALGAFWMAVLHAEKEVSDQSARIHRLISVIRWEYVRRYVFLRWGSYLTYQSTSWDVVGYVRFTHIQLNLVISNSLISNNRLSRSENLVLAETWTSNNRHKKNGGKEEKLGAISPLFHNIFDSSNFKSPITYIFVKCGCSNYFSSVLRILYVEVRISRSF